MNKKYKINESSI